MECERQPPPPPAAAAVSKVLDDDDLLAEILLRVGFPTTLVRSALVCKRWLGHASEPAFLRRFRELHPPRLLGFYIDHRYCFNVPPSFIPMSPQPAELAAVVRRARFSAYRRLLTDALDCRNGSLFVTLYRDKRVLGVIRPMCRERALTIIPSLPCPQLPFGSSCIFRQVLSKEGDGLSLYYLYVESTVGNRESRLHVYMMQDGSWRGNDLLDMDQLPRPRSTPKAVLVDSKIYMAAGRGEILVLDLTTSSFSTVLLPRGVEHGNRGTTMLSRASDSSGVYLIHVEEFQLCIWLRKGGNWLLVDSICLHDMCVNLRKSDSTIKDSSGLYLMNQVVDYADFLFLKMGGCVLHLDIKCRTLRKVYEKKSARFGDIHPFMMIWPPTFPALKYYPTRNAA